MEISDNDIGAQPMENHTTAKDGDKCPVCDTKGIYNAVYMLCSTLASLKTNVDIKR